MPNSEGLPIESVIRVGTDERPEDGEHGDQTVTQPASSPPGCAGSGPPQRSTSCRSDES